MKPSPVRIEWMDSKAWAEWMSKESVSENVRGKSVMSSVGFLVEKDDENVVIAQSNHESYFGGLLKIPAVAVLTITALAVVIYACQAKRTEAEKVLCSSFLDQSSAQTALVYNPMLDGDKDGVACEILLK